MNLSTARGVLVALIFIGAVTLVLPLPTAVRVPFGILQAYYLPGLVFLLLVGSSKRTLLDTIFIPPLISPVILSLLVTAVEAITGSLGISIRVSLVILYLLFIAALRTAKPGGSEEPQPVPHAIVPIALLFSMVVISTYLVNDYLLVYADAWHHISVANEILDRGIPPMAPFLPDVPLRYMWFYHLFHTVFAELSGLSIRVVMGLFNAINAFVFAYLIARLISHFTSKHRYILTAPLFAFAGLESAGWVLWPVRLLRAFTGEERGRAEIARIVDNIEINGAEVIYFLRPPWTWLMNLLDKFVTLTAFSYSLNLFLLCFILVIARDFHRESGVKAALCILLAVIGAFLFHVVTGTTLILTLIGAGILALIADRVRKTGRTPRFETVVLPVLAVIAAALTFPYFRTLTGGGAGGGLKDYLHFGLINLLTVAAPLIVLIPFSLRALSKIVSSDSGVFWTLLRWLISLFILCLFVNLPGLAENKIVFPLFLLLSPFITWQLVDGLRAARGVRLALLSIWIAILFLVPPVLSVRGFMLEKPKTPHFEKRHRITEGECKLFAWIRENTDINAVIVEKNTYNLAPVYARRRNFFLNSLYIRVHNYGGEKLERYRAIRDEIYSAEPISPETIESLRDIGLDIYVVAWAGDVIEVPDLDRKFTSHPEWFERVYENTAGAVYAVTKQ